MKIRIGFTVEDLIRRGVNLGESYRRDILEKIKRLRHIKKKEWFYNIYRKITILTM